MSFITPQIKGRVAPWDQPQKLAAQDAPAAQPTPEQERLAATTAWAERQGLLTLAARLRQFLAADRAKR